MFDYRTINRTNFHFITRQFAYVHADFHQRFCIKAPTYRY